MKGFSLMFLAFLLSFSTVIAQEGSYYEVDISVDKGDDATYYDGEPIFISFITTEDAYVVIYDIDTEGKLSLIFPESIEENGFIRANSTYQIPEDDDDYSLKIKGPQGEEFICAVTSPEPLRIPAIFKGEGEVHFRIEGDPLSAIEKINEELIVGTGGIHDIDICHLFVEYGEEGRKCPLPPFPFPPFSCSMEIVSKPKGAKIYFDGRYFGKTPAVIAGIPPGNHRLVIKKGGYYRYERYIFLHKGEREFVKVHLKWKRW